MKWLILFALIVLLITMIVLRYRRHLQTALHVWRMFRRLRQASKASSAESSPPPAEKTVKREIDKNEPLVRCARCGKWVARSDALNLRSKTVYCSAACMERAARIESLVDRS